MKSNNYEDIRDKYLHLVYRIHERYQLPEECLADLTITYCETIHRNLYTTKSGHWPWRLQCALTQKAQALIKAARAKRSYTVVPLHRVEEETYYMEQPDMRLLIEQLSDLLPDRYWYVVEQRFLKSIPTSQIAQKLGVSNSRVQQLYKGALQKCRHYIFMSDLYGVCKVK